MNTEAEIAARNHLAHVLALDVSITAPSWRQIVLFGAPVRVDLPRVSDRVGTAIESPFEPIPGDDVSAKVAELLDGMRTSRPQPTPPKNVGSKPLPPARDAVAKWSRSVWLVVTGPDALRLLAGAGYLTPRDVQVIGAAYPNGLDAERGLAVAATIHLAEAGLRRDQSIELPSWLNEQLYTLMDNRPPLDFYEKLYQSENSHPQAASRSSKSPMAEQARPNPSPDR